MRAGLLRVQYWAVDEAGARAELLASVEQDEHGAFSPVFTSDPRPIERVLQLRDGASWREVRSERLVPSSPRVLPGPNER